MIKTEEIPQNKYPEFSSKQQRHVSSSVSSSKCSDTYT